MVEGEEKAELAGTGSAPSGGEENEEKWKQANGNAGKEKDGNESKHEEGKRELSRARSGGPPQLTSMDKAKGGNSAKSSYVRAADLVNLADLDAALEKHLHRGSTLNSAKPSKRKLLEWEIDPEKLVIKDAIAHGTYGTVHKGVYDNQDVAVKLLDWGEEDTMTRVQLESFRNAFRQEVEVWHKLNHPNVTKFIGASIEARGQQIPSFQSGNDGYIHIASNICCVVVEYLAGGTLKDYLIRNRRRKLAFKVVIQLALDLCRGLAYLHEKKIVHRDVKTENMLLDTKRIVKIADFGVARVEASNPRDMTGETGTLGYMAPEVLDGKPYNHKCDVYSFGICLWEVYCCDMPYPDISFAEMSNAIVRLHVRPIIPRCCPNALAQVMRKCWDPSPNKRPEMAQVVEMIEAIDTSKGGGMIPTDSHGAGCLPFPLPCISRRGP